MWYRRFVSWLRSLFTSSSQVNAQPAPRDSETPTLPMTAPLRAPFVEPFVAQDQSATLPPLLEFPALHEPPTTIPLARLARPSQPLTGLQASGDSSGPLFITRAERELSPPSQPSLPSQPLASAPLPDDITWPEATERADVERDAEDGEELSIEPGSDLYRRLMILRRLVRQRIYNEGFPPDATPEQYRRYPGQDGFSAPFSDR